MASFRSEYRVGVPLAVETVWDVLADLPAWPQWNPLYERLEGALRIGSQLDVVQNLGGRQVRTHPIVMDWVPHSQILWRQTSWAGMIIRLRYFELERLHDQGCIFSCGEVVQGRMTELIDTRRNRRNLYRMCEITGEALRERMLPGWRETGDGPTSTPS